MLWTLFLESRRVRIAASISIDWNCTNISSLNSLHETFREKRTLAIRIYLSALTLVFLIAASLNRGVSALEAIVVTCALVYLILDARECLQVTKEKLNALEQLEEQLSAILHH